MGFTTGKKTDKPGSPPQGFVNEAAAAKMLSRLPADEFALRLSSKMPVPGGGVLSKAAMQAAWLNVRINVRLIKDEKFA
ncbi:MAG: cyclodeaminase/cyclohydrolase family protein [Clostridiales Family XIII bacterium]|jgi:formiminotetrahydrofolate cyclodeaminase|nr:cyclodeaminase/cyclohydrolase family protein [Clostridiales Family XIII bacterium]